MPRHRAQPPDCQRGPRNQASGAAQDRGTVCCCLRAQRQRAPSPTDWYDDVQMGQTIGACIPHSQDGLAPSSDKVWEGKAGAVLIAS
jgi:hypothetical protein